MCKAISITLIIFQVASNAFSHQLESSVHNELVQSNTANWNGFNNSWLDLNLKNSKFRIAGPDRQGLPVFVVYLGAFNLTSIDNTLEAYSDVLTSADMQEALHGAHSIVNLLNLSGVSFEESVALVVDFSGVDVALIIRRFGPAIIKFFIKYGNAIATFLDEYLAYAFLIEVNYSTFSILQILQLILPTAYSKIHVHGTTSTFWQEALSAKISLDRLPPLGPGQGL